MTLDEAIKILIFRLNETESYIEIDERDAIHLGIEAMKRVKLQHDPAGCTTERLLPGETED